MEGISVQLNLLAFDPVLPFMERVWSTGFILRCFHNETFSRHAAAFHKHTQAGWSWSCILPDHSVLLMSWSSLLFGGGGVVSTTLIPQTRLSQNKLMRGPWPPEKDYPIFTRSVQHRKICKTNLASCHYQWEICPFLATRSQKKRPSADSEILYTASLGQWVSVNHEHRFWDSSAIISGKGVWPGQAAYKFWMTVHAFAGAEATGNDVAHPQKTEQALCNDP